MVQNDGGGGGGGGGDRFDDDPRKSDVACSSTNQATLRPGCCVGGWKRKASWFERGMLVDQEETKRKRCPVSSSIFCSATAPQALVVVLLLWPPPSSFSRLSLCPFFERKKKQKKKKQEEKKKKKKEFIVTKDSSYMKRKIRAAVDDQENEVTITIRKRVGSGVDEEELWSDGDDSNDETEEDESSKEKEDPFARKTRIELKLKETKRRIRRLLCLLVTLCFFMFVVPLLVVIFYPEEVSSFFRVGSRGGSSIANSKYQMNRADLEEDRALKARLLQKLGTKMPRGRNNRPPPKTSFLFLQGSDDLDPILIYSRPALLANKSNITPSSQFLAPGTDGEERGREDGEADWEPIPGVSIQRELYRLQHPSDCSQARILVYSYANENECGHGCQVHYISLALSFAYLAERTLIINFTAPWMLKGESESDKEGIGNDFFRDYFLPLSSCSLSDIADHEQPPFVESAEVPDRNKRDNESFGKATVRSPQKDPRRIVYADTAVMWPWMQRSYAQRVPHKFRERGILWWRSQLVTYILRPSTLTIDIINEQDKDLSPSLLLNRPPSLPISSGDALLTSTVDTARNNNNNNSSTPVPIYNFLGVHMRHGVSTVVKGNRRHFPFEKYLEVANQLASELTWRDPGSDSIQHPSSILLSTEHPEELEEAKRVAQQKGATKTTKTPARIVHVKEVETDAHSLILQRQAIVHRRLHVICIKNLYLQLRSSMFVGTFSSNFSRMIVELMIGLGKTVRAASLDMEWFVNP